MCFITDILTHPLMELRWFPLFYFYRQHWHEWSCMSPFCVDILFLSHRGVPMRGIAEPYNNLILCTLKSSPSVFQNGNTSFHFYCQWGFWFLHILYNTAVQLFDYINPGGASGKEPPTNAGHAALMPGLGRSPGGGHDNPFQYSFLGHPMVGGAWRAMSTGLQRIGHNWSDLACMHPIVYQVMSYWYFSLHFLKVLLLFSCSVMSDSSQPHGLQHARLPCPSPSPGACSNSCSLSPWCHPTISSSVILSSSCFQSFSASGSFLMNRFFASSGQSTGASVSAFNFRAIRLRPECLMTLNVFLSVYCPFVDFL